MLTGDSMRRTPEKLGRNMQQCYRCFSEPDFGGSMYSPCFDPKWDTDHLPKQACPGGIRSNIIFPLYAPSSLSRILMSVAEWRRRYGSRANTTATDYRCWDGQSLDSPDHREHVAHPVGGPPSFSVVSGTCPESHPVKIPQVMLEVGTSCFLSLQHAYRGVVSANSETPYKVNWDTRGFNDESEWPEDGSQPFVLSTGDG